MISLCKTIFQKYFPVGFLIQKLLRPRKFSFWAPNYWLLLFNNSIADISLVKVGGISHELCWPFY